MSQLIKSLPVRGLKLLGVGGQPVIDTHRQISNVLTKHFGPEYQTLLALPKRDGGKPIDWYTPDGLPDGEIRQLTSLPDAERAQARAELSKKLDAVRAKAAEFMASPDDTLARLGERLDKASQFPDDRFVFLVGGQPVIIGWGTQAEHVHTDFPDLGKPIEPPKPPKPIPGTAQDTLDEDARPGPGPVPAPGATEVRPYWIVQSPFPLGALLSMLALLIFLAGIVLSLVPACGVNGVLSPWNWRNVWCDAAVAAAADKPDATETARLEDELARLRSAIAAAPCPNPPPQRVEAPPAPPPPPEPPSKAAESVTEAGGKIGAVNVILRWTGRAVDLDLHVHCPDGGHIFHGKLQDCGGEMDLDMNFGSKYSDTPVENIVFPEGQAKPGRYRVQVRRIGSSGDPTPFEVIVRIKGKETRYPGATSDSVDIATFDLE